MSLRQSVTPQRLLGRVNASMEVVMLGFQLLGALLAGVLAETVGIRWALFTGSSFMVFGGVWMLFSPIWNLATVPDSDAS
jgi:predicted Co/Zn/Cd cation transporter (cation efflux family)